MVCRFADEILGNRVSEMLNGWCMSAVAVPLSRVCLGVIFRLLVSHRLEEWKAELLTVQLASIK